MADLSGGLQCDKGFDGLGERHPAAPVQQVQVDDLGAHALQAALAGGDGAAPARISGQHLADKEYFFTLSGDRLAHQCLRASVAVHFGGVDQREAAFYPETQRGELLIARGAVVPHVPGAQTERGHAFSRGECDHFHGHVRTLARWVKGNV